MVSQRYVELQTAKAWGIAPHEWDAMPEEAKAEAMALLETEAQMGEIDAHYREHERHAQEMRQSAKGGGRHRR